MDSLAWYKVTAGVVRNGQVASVEVDILAESDFDAIDVFEQTIEGDMALLYTIGEYVGTWEEYQEKYGIDGEAEPDPVVQLQLFTDEELAF